MGLGRRSRAYISHVTNNSASGRAELQAPFAQGSKAGASGISAADVPAIKRSFELLEGLSQVFPVATTRETCACSGGMEVMLFRRQGCPCTPLLLSTYVRYKFASVLCLAVRTVHARLEHYPLFFSARTTNR